MGKAQRVVDRLLARVGLQRRPGSRAVYAGASFSNNTLDWITGVLSADQAIKSDLRRLRDRSRALVRDFSYASRFVQAVAENVAGPHGVTLQVRTSTAAGDFKRSLNGEIEAAWAEWCEDPTAEGGLGFADVEHLLCETLPQDGAFLVRLVTGYTGNRFRFAIQVLDVDQLDHTLSVHPAPGVNEIRQGVEVDRWGRAVAYWLWTVHPSEYGRGVRERVRVPADEIVHGYIRRRAGQTHGVPWYAPVLLDERMLQGFQEAAVTAARVGASSSFWLKPNPEHVDPLNPTLDTSVSMEIEPGVGQVLPVGYDAVERNPAYPNNEFDPFSKAILGSIATGLRVSHMTLTGDLRGANYSSMRAGLLPERDAWRLLHGWFTRTLHRRVYRAWLRAGVLAGAIAVPPREMDRALQGARWLPRGFPWVDPEKDMRARLMGVAACVDSLTAICAEQGKDFEEVVAERAREIAIAERAGVPIDLILGKTAQSKTDEETPNSAANGAGDTPDGTDQADGADGAAAASAGGRDRAGRDALRLARGR